MELIHPENFNPQLAHIIQDGRVFQVLNDDETDWDEQATAKAMADFLAQEGK